MKKEYRRWIAVLVFLCVYPTLFFTAFSHFYTDEIPAEACYLEAENTINESTYTEVFNDVYSEEETSDISADPYPARKIINVKYIGQEPDYPCGCEGISAVMLLDYHGIKVDTDEFFRKYLDTHPFTYNSFTNTYYGEDMDRYYVGDPTSPFGKGCYAPVIKTAMEKIVPDSYIAVVEQGYSLAYLADKYLKKAQTPILVWATTGMKDSFKGTRWFIKRNGEWVDFPAYMHCMVLVGYDDDKNLYYFNDPWKNSGLVAYDKALAEEKFGVLGKQALALMPKSEYRTETTTVKSGKAYALRNAATGKYMTVLGDNVIQSTYLGNGQQQFTVNKHEDGSISLINTATGKAVDIKGSNVQVSAPDGSPTQSFFTKAGSGGFLFIVSAELPFSSLAVYGNYNGDIGNANLSVGNIYANDTGEMKDYYKLWEFVEVEEMEKTP